MFDTAAVIDVVRKGKRINQGVKAYAPRPMVIVDPVMGDAPGGLYVPAAIAAGIKDQLIPRADLITPNAFELGHITGRQLTDLASMVRAARSIDCPCLVSSLPRHGQIGVMYVDQDEAWIVTHDRVPKAPNGTGDLLTAAFVSAIAFGADPKTALERSVAVTLALVQQARDWQAPELPVVAAAHLLREPGLSLEAEAL